MPPFLANDLATVRFLMPDPDAAPPAAGAPPPMKEAKTVLAWGDEVELLSAAPKKSRIRFRGPQGTMIEGDVAGEVRVQQNGLLKLSMVDVQQGDGMILESPDGKVVLIDGGDNVMFARHCAARFRGTSAAAPKTIDAVMITHGDADHFAGLVKIRDSEKLTAADTREFERKRLFIKPLRVYHHGLVKGPTEVDGKSVKDALQFGGLSDDEKFMVELVDDLRDVDDKRMNTPFRSWKKALVEWSKRFADPKQMVVRRLHAGVKGDPFGFLQPSGVKVEVIGPIEEQTTRSGQAASGLRLLHAPKRAVEMPGGPTVGTGVSASHTVNGHSVVIRVTLGNVRFLLTGDLNQESMKRLDDAVGLASLDAEIGKVPHHGSGDFDLKALQSIGAAVWLISSGDESARKEYIHPRATMLGALGRASRKTGDAPPLIFCTELAAFFEMRGNCAISPPKPAPANEKEADRKKREAANAVFFGFRRANFGIIHVRTDGKRVLVFTHSADAEMKEAYAFSVADDGKHTVTFEDVKPAK